jgi:hypothetical protein
MFSNILLNNCCKKFIFLSYYCFFNNYSLQITKSIIFDLEELIQSLHFDYIHGEGKCGDGDWDGEESFLIFGISENQASEIGKKFEQNAIVWCGKDAIPQLVLLK